MRMTAPLSRRDLASLCLTCVLLLVVPVSAQKATPLSQVAKVYGKIQLVTSFPDYKVQVVSSFPDLKVQKVASFPDAVGKWQIVESFPDFKIQIVESFPDFKIQYVESFPGLAR